MASTESQKNAELLLLAAYRGGVNDPKELANFMGQMQVESQGFTKAHESLNYSAERLLAVFPGRNGMDTLKEAKAIVAGGQERIAEAIYGGKWGEGLGNKPNSGDSFDFRGRGFVQLTGRSNYEHYGKAIGLDLAKHHFQRSKLKFFRMRDRQRCTEPRRTGRAATKEIMSNYHKKPILLDAYAAGVAFPAELAMQPFTHSPSAALGINSQ